jgi:hydroxymethylpyrimidine kinase/phosphomethylpyrimidine kinase
MAIPKVLFLSGSDSGGGAGIQADIKAAAALGAHGMTAITALTAQNTVGVQGIHDVPLDFVRAQFNSIADDIGFDAAKTGMLHTTDLVNLVAELLTDAKAPVVVDPVMVAKGGDRLLTTDAVEAVRSNLLPVATLVTPNLDEAEELLGRPINTPEHMKKAAREMVQMGAGAALVKGGHLPDDPCDVLFDGENYFEFDAPRIDTPHTHATGCTLASSCAALLAAGWELPAAVERARLLVRRAIAGGLAIGHGRGPVHAMADLESRLMLGPCMQEMQEALRRLEDTPGLAHMIPEIRGQMGYALPGAVGFDEVLAVPGRITHIGDRLKAVGSPWPGASQHVAKIVLTATEADPTKRAAMALNFTDELVEKAKALGWKVGEFSRADEPDQIKQKEGSSLEWGTASVIQKMGEVPDAIFDRGEVGKEPVLRILGSNPQELVNMVLALAGKEEES